jgi:hypothetical protein
MGPALAEYFLLERVEPGIDDGAPSGVSDVARRSIKRRYTASQRCSGVSVSDTWTSLVGIGMAHCPIYFYIFFLVISAVPWDRSDAEEVRSPHN